MDLDFLRDDGSVFMITKMRQIDERGVRVRYFTQPNSSFGISYATAIVPPMN
jgi:hypothetical protein